MVVAQTQVLISFGSFGPSSKPFTPARAVVTPTYQSFLSPRDSKGNPSFESEFLEIDLQTRAH